MFLNQESFMLKTSLNYTNNNLKLKKLYEIGHRMKDFLLFVQI